MPRKTTEELRAQTYEELFGLPPNNWTEERLRRSFKTMALRYHPDSMTEARLSAEEWELFNNGAYEGAFLLINDTYDKLLYNKKTQDSQSNQSSSTRSTFQSAQTTSTILTSPLINQLEEIFSHFRPLHTLEENFREISAAFSSKAKVEERMAILRYYMESFYLGLSKISDEIEAGDVTLEQAQVLAKPENHDRAMFLMRTQENWDLIDAGILSVMDVINNIAPYHLPLIATHVVRTLLLKRLITLEDVKTITTDRFVLMGKEISILLENKPAFLWDILTLNFQQSLALVRDGGKIQVEIVDALAAGIIKFQMLGAFAGLTKEKISEKISLLKNNTRLVTVPSGMYGDLNSRSNGAYSIESLRKK